MCIRNRRFERAMAEERRRDRERQAQRAIMRAKNNERARLDLIARQDRDIDLD